MAQIQELLLLVGTNPLPNFVSARYLLNRHRELKRIWFVSSDRTYASAQRLSQLLDPSQTLEIKHKKIDDVGNSSSIRATINDILALVSSDTWLHLNYTGGTKAMVAHAYQMLSERENSTYSYLDSRTHQLIFDEDAFAHSQALTHTIKISFEELYQLHGFEIHKTQDELNLERALPLLQELIVSDQLPTVFSEQPGAYQRKLFVNQKGELADRFNKVAEREVLEQFRANNKLIELCEAISKTHPFFNRDGSINSEIANKTFKEIVKILDGTWLEAYLYQQLRQLLEPVGFPLVTNVELKRPEWPVNSCFELDVLALNGYQIFATSCTTSDKKHICKSKGFEVLHRAHQIGGDEARCILLCGANDDTTEVLQNELDLDMGMEGNSNILVIGKSSWKPERLQAKFKQYLKLE